MNGIPEPDKPVYFQYESASVKLVILKTGADKDFIFVSSLRSKVYNQGHATGVMQEVCKVADKLNLEVRLFARRYGRKPVLRTLNSSNSTRNSVLRSQN